MQTRVVCSHSYWCQLMKFIMHFLCILCCAICLYLHIGTRTYNSSSKYCLPKGMFSFLSLYALSFWDLQSLIPKDSFQAIGNEGNEYSPSSLFPYIEGYWWSAVCHLFFLEIFALFLIVLQENLNPSIHLCIFCLICFVYLRQGFSV